MSDPDFEKLLSDLKAQGVSHADALKAIHATHPGLRKKWEQAQEAKKRSGLDAALKAVQAASGSESPRDKSAASALAYTPIDLEAIRRAVKRERPPAEPGQAEEKTSITSTGGKDYFQLVREVKQRRGCDFATAAAEVNRTHPQAWAEMLRKANPGRSDAELFGGR